MSYYTSQDLVPDFLVVKPGLNSLKENYNSWKSLILYPPDARLRAPQSDQERTALTRAWDICGHSPSYCLYSTSQLCAVYKNLGDKCSTQQT